MKTVTKYCGVYNIGRSEMHNQSKKNRKEEKDLQFLLQSSCTVKW